MKVKISDVIIQRINGLWGEEPLGLDDTPVFRVSNLLSDGTIDYENLEYRDLKNKNLDKYYLKKGDIMVAKSGNPKFSYFDGDENKYISCNFILTLRPNPSIIIPKLLFYVIYYMNDTHILDDCYSKVTIQNMNVNSFLAKEFDLPNLNEQEKIVKELDHIINMTMHENNDISFLNELLKTVFVEMFGNVIKNEKKWNMSKMADIASLITDGKHGGCVFEENSGYYFIGAKEINNYRISYTSAPQVAFFEYQETRKRCKLEIGDLLIVNTGATIGKTAIVDDSIIEKCIIAKSVAMIKPCKDKVLPTYLQYCYECYPELYSDLSGSAQKNLLLSTIKETIISIPSYTLQKKFDSIVSKVGKIKANKEKYISNLKELLDKKIFEYFGD